MSLHETAALRYWRNLNSTLSVIGADPVILDEADRCRYEKLTIDEAALWLAQQQQERRRDEHDHGFGGDLGWGPFTNAPSKGESWGRR